MSYTLTIDEDLPENCPSCERFWDYENGHCRAEKNHRIPEVKSLLNPEPRPDWCPLQLKYDPPKRLKCICGKYGQRPYTDLSKYNPRINDPDFSLEITYYLKCPYCGREGKRVPLKMYLNEGWNKKIEEELQNNE